MPLPTLRLPASKRQLSLLGARLAEGKKAPGDDALYEAMLDVYDSAQQVTRAAVENMQLPEHLGGSLDVTGRTKTLDTLVQKLRRTPETRLPYIRDIAGVRVVGDFRVAQQRAFATQLQDVLGPGGPIVDRIAEPASGYRAVHVVARVQGIPVEIQVRTRLQHAWAETFERVADRWGRQIRYGEPPDDGPAPPENEFGVNTRAEVVELLQAISTGLIASTERLTDRVFDLDAMLRSVRVKNSLTDLDAEPELATAEAEVAGLREQLRSVLLKVGALVVEDSYSGNES